MSVINENQIKHFDPLSHVPPKYDVFGRLKKIQFIPGADKTNILKEKENVKIPWKANVSENGEPMTRTKLLENRRKEKIPDITYDLDRDGFVGGRDYVLAKRYDKDKDGKLNEKETREAYEGIYNNVEDNYVWNLENQGSNRAYRILQKRGKVVDAEDFLPLRDTYPVHPLSSKRPGVETLTELRERRKLLTKKEIDGKMKKWEESNPNVYVNEPLNINTANKPQFTSIKQKKEFGHKLARINCGLKETEDEIKVGKDPSLAYVYDPNHKTQKDLKKQLQKENMEFAQKLPHMEHKNEIDRLNEREDEIFANLYFNNEERMTFKKLKEERRKETLDYNSKTFSNQVIGVHGHELPKFADNEGTKEYWKLKEGYVENPEVNSLVVLKENIKYWKKPEELLINEHQDGLPSPDSFSKIKVMKEKQDNLVIKVNNLNHFQNKGFDPDNPKPIDLEEAHRNHIYRWTTLVNQFAPQKFKKGRLFDSLPQARNSKDDKGMYSSFAENGIFESNFMRAAIERKKEDKHMKANDHERVNIDHHQHNQTKDNLFQRFSSKESKGIDRPKSFSIRTKGF